MLRLDVALPSGKRKSLEVPQSSKVGDLKILAQKTFCRGFLQLVTTEGHVLRNLEEPLQSTGIQEGDCITAIQLQAKVAATRDTEDDGDGFSLYCCGGSSIVWWGSFGTKRFKVRHQKTVQQIQANECAFAAVLSDGSVVTWGDPDYGGDSYCVRRRLKNVDQIQASTSAFAAIRSDGSVVTWGDPDCGGDSSQVQGQLKNVQQIQANEISFAAIRSDGSVVTWGLPDDGGDSSEVRGQLKNVEQIQATGSAFAAIRSDGSVVTWGDPDCGGDNSQVQGQLKNVQQIQANEISFAAILLDGSLVTWSDGNDSSSVQRLVPNL